MKLTGSVLVKPIGTPSNFESGNRDWEIKEQGRDVYCQSVLLSISHLYHDFTAIPEFYPSGSKPSIFSSYTFLTHYSELKVPQIRISKFLDEETFQFEKYLNTNALDEDFYQNYILLIENQLKYKYDIKKIKKYIFNSPEDLESKEPTIEIFFKKQEGLEIYDYFNEFQQIFDRILASNSKSYDDFEKLKIRKNKFRFIISVI